MCKRLNLQITLLARSMDTLVMGPARWFRKTVVEPARGGEAAPWYHRQYNRVPTIDECYIEDVVCR